MNPFWVSEILDRHGQKTLYINPLPEKICTFDCVFCPIEERTSNKTDQCFHFDDTAALLIQMENTLKEGKVDQVFIMPDGEGLANADLPDIIKLAKNHNCRVKVITNGYILNHPDYKSLMLQCDEVIGELMTCNEIDFQKLQRPIEGYTLEAYVDNMAAFRKEFKGEFNLSITLLKNHSDNNSAMEFFKKSVNRIKPDHVFIETPEEGKLQQAFGVDAVTVERFDSALNNK